MCSLFCCKTVHPKITEYKKAQVLSCDNFTNKKIDEDIESLEIELSSKMPTNWLSQFHKLKKINFESLSDSVLNIPDSVEEIHLSACKNVTILNAPQSLKVLYLSDSDNLKIERNLRDFPNLEVIKINGLDGLTISSTLPSTTKSISILNNITPIFTCLDISGCPNIEKISVNYNVHDIILRNNANLKEIQIFDMNSFNMHGDIPLNIENIAVRNVAFTKLYTICCSKYKKLISLTIEKCSNLKLTK